MSQSQVRVRFAPSPTGPLHIGGVRTALFNYLFAKKHNGKFILRIEDTDQTRFVEGAEKYINDSLEWLGLTPDEGVLQGGKFGPYKQSERNEIYKKYADELIAKGWAYYAFDSAEDLDKLRAQYESDKMTFAYDCQTRKQLCNSLTLSESETNQRLSSDGSWVIRFKMPEDFEIHATDLIRGDVKFMSNTLDDKVLYKSAENLPTYHLANIVDDHLMEISHVIRGEEWLPSLPLHVMLYKAFGWDKTMPHFAHLPLILKPSGKGKLSKRDGDKEGFPVFPIQYEAPNGEIASGYREAGYFPDAVNNLLALLGWNSGTEQEVFSIEELSSLFSLDRVNKSGARFDPEKAKWFNHQYLIAKPNNQLAELFNLELTSKNISMPIEKIETIVGLVKERINFVSELWSQTFFFFEAPSNYDEKVVQKRWKDQVPKFMLKLSQMLSTHENWTCDSIKEATSQLISSENENFGNIMNTLRLVLVGGSFGPDLFTIVELIGKDQTVARINKACTVL